MQTEEDFKEGDKVRIVKIGPKDAYLGRRAELIGLAAIVGEGFQKVGDWYRGSMEIPSFYKNRVVFHQVKVTARGMTLEEVLTMLEKKV